MKPVQWRLYYDHKLESTGRDTFDSNDGEPESAPARGFICAAFPDHDQEGNSIGRMVMWSWDRYFYHEDYDEWWGCSVSGLDDRLADRLTVRAVMFGRTIHTTLFRAIYERASNDPDFPAKSGIKPIETPMEDRNRGPVTASSAREVGTAHGA